MNARLLLLLASVLCSCGSERMAGGSTSETTNGLTLKVEDGSGVPAARVRVRLRPVDYLESGAPATPDRSLGVIDTITDDSGQVRLPSGLPDVRVEAYGSPGAVQIRVDSGIKGSVSLRLALPSRLRGTIALQPGEGAARVQVRGLEHSAWTDSNGVFSLDSLPAGRVRIRAWIPGRSKSIESPLDLVPGAQSDAGVLSPGREVGIWTDSVRVFLNTLDGGAATTTRVDSVPVLVRLDGARFPTSAKPDGSDLRVADSSGVPLPFCFASWAPSSLSARIWVLMPSVRAADSTQWFRMRWGNSAADDVSAPWAVFPASGGWAGSWDLGRNYFDRGGRWRVSDASSRRDDGILTGTPTIDPVEGLHFRAGGRDGLAMSGSGTNLTGNFTVLIHANPELSGIILFGRGDSVWNHGLKQFFLQASKTLVRKRGWYPAFMAWADTGYNVYSVSNTAVDSSAWSLLVARHTLGAGDSGAVDWFIQGAKTTSTLTAPTQYEADKTRDSLILGFRHAEGSRFRGSMSEIWIINRALSNDWVKLQSECRKPAGTLVRFRP